MTTESSPKKLRGYWGCLISGLAVLLSGFLLLPSISHTPSRAEGLKMLKSPNPEQRSNGVVAVGQKQPLKDSIQLVVNVLKTDPDEKVRSTAAMVLGEHLRHLPRRYQVTYAEAISLFPSVLDGLNLAMDDPAKDVRFTAIAVVYNGIFHYKESPAYYGYVNLIEGRVPQLVKGLHDSNADVRSRTCEVISLFGQSQRPVLKKLLEDVDAEVRQDATDALDCISRVHGD